MLLDRPGDVVMTAIVSASDGGVDVRHDRRPVDALRYLLADVRHLDDAERSLDELFGPTQVGPVERPFSELIAWIDAAELSTLTDVSVVVEQLVAGTVVGGPADPTLAGSSTPWIRLIGRLRGHPDRAIVAAEAWFGSIVDLCEGRFGVVTPNDPDTVAAYVAACCALRCGDEGLAEGWLRRGHRTAGCDQLDGEVEGRRFLEAVRAAHPEGREPWRKC